MTDFKPNLEPPRRSPATDNDHEAMPRAARLAERLAYSDDPQDQDLWHQVRREVAEIYERLG